MFHELGIIISGVVLIDTLLFPFLSGLESLSASYSGLKLPNSNGGVGDGGVSKFLVAVLITGNCIGGGEFVFTSESDSSSSSSSISSPDKSLIKSPVLDSGASSFG